jgi:hypothetical protein
MLGKNTRIGAIALMMILLFLVIQPVNAGTVGCRIACESGQFFCQAGCDHTYNITDPGYLACHATCISKGVACMEGCDLLEPDEHEE